MSEPERATTDRPCPRREWVLSALSNEEGPGDAGTASLVHAHLSECPSCAEMANRVGQVVGALRNLARIEPPESLLRQARAGALAATGRRAVFGARRRRTLAERLPLYAAAAAIALAVLIPFLNRPDRPTPLARRSPPDDAPSPALNSAPGRGDEAPTSLSPPPDSAVSEGAATARKPARMVRRHRSHEEAAAADDPQPVQAAFVLPDPAERDLGWLRWFDNSAAADFTIGFQTKP